MKKRFPIIWLTGNSGSGKTTLAYGARDYFNENTGVESSIGRRVIVLDGDEMRNTISVDEGFSAEDRRRHNHRVSRLANLMAEHGFMVIVSVIAPFQKVRDELQPICDPHWIYLKRSGLEANDRPYEPPTDPELTIDNDSNTIEESISRFISYIKGIEMGSSIPKHMPIKKDGHAIKQ